MSKKITQHNQRSHAVLSASGSSRWMNCTPSPRLEEKVKSTHNRYADEGTLAHEFSENEIRFQLDMISEEDYMKIYNRIKSNAFFNADFVNHCQTYIDYVLEQYEASKIRSGDKSSIIVEEKVDFSEYVPDGSGTSDISILEPKILEVIDLKFGIGVKVSPVGNTQGMLYGLGSLKNNELIYDFEIIRITIVQPRLDMIQTWEITIDELIEWAENEVRPKASEAFEGKGNLNPGSWCQFCKVKQRCPALNKLFLAEAKEDFKKEPIQKLIEHELLTDEELIESYKQFSVVASWMKTVTEYIYTSALEGKKWEGYKLVEGKSTRKLVEVDKLVLELKKLKVPRLEYIKESLITMTDMEKLLKRTKPELINIHIHKPEGSPTLVEVSNPAPEWSSLSQAKSDFSNTENEEDFSDVEDFSDIK